MKRFSVIAIAVSLLLIILTSPPYSHPDSAGSSNHTSAYWVNPDGTRGLMMGAGEPPASPRPQYAWINPDGNSGTDQGHSNRSSAKDYSWVNPDGAVGKISPVHAHADGADPAF